MNRLFKRAGVIAALLTISAPLIAEMPQIPRHILSIRNTTNIVLTCRLQIDGYAAETLPLSPGQEWQRRVTSTTSMGSMTCAAPVRRVLFKLQPGRRYVLLRSATKEGYLRGGKGDPFRTSSMLTVDLRDVTIGS